MIILETIFVSIIVLTELLMHQPKQYAWGEPRIEKTVLIENPYMFNRIVENTCLKKSI